MFLFVSKPVSFSSRRCCKSATISLLSFARDCTSSSSCLTLARSFRARYNSSCRLETFSCFSTSSLFNSSLSSCAVARRSSYSEPFFKASNSSLSEASFLRWSNSILDLILTFSSCRLLTSTFRVVFSALNISMVSSLLAQSLLRDSRRISCSWTLLWRRICSPLVSLLPGVNVLTCCSRLFLILSIRCICVSKEYTLFLLICASDRNLSSSSSSSSRNFLVFSSSSRRDWVSSSRSLRSPWQAW